MLAYPRSATTTWPCCTRMIVTLATYGVSKYLSQKTCCVGQDKTIHVLSASYNYSLMRSSTRLPGKRGLRCPLNDSWAASPRFPFYRGTMATRKQLLIQIQRVGSPRCSSVDPPKNKIKKRVFRRCISIPTPKS